jgi:hypothetical protein
MKVFWLDGGLKLDPECEQDRRRLSALEPAIRSLSGLVIAEPNEERHYTSPELTQTVVGSASNAR